MIEPTLAAIGRPFIAVYKLTDNVGQFVVFYAKLFIYFFLPPYRIGLVLRQIDTIGFGSIGVIGAYVGYFTTGGARGVGIATTKAVVLSAVSIFIVNYFLSVIFLSMGW